MQVTYSDTKKVTPSLIARSVKRLNARATSIAEVLAEMRADDPAVALATWKDEGMLEEVVSVAKHFKKVDHVVLIGIGGSSLGVEAVHSVLATENHPTLHVLDTVAPHELERVLVALGNVRRATQIAVVVVSKSGTTTETLANAEILLGSLAERWGKAIYHQTVMISDLNAPLHATAKRLKTHHLSLPHAVGGRYSVGTPVGLLPLLLLGHDIEAFLTGLAHSAEPAHEHVAREGAARLAAYLALGYTETTFFAFDTRLVRLGKWYRQLLAESVGKEQTRRGTRVRRTLTPTVITPVELHSVGQLYFSGTAAAYTDFVSFDDDVHDFAIPGKPAIATGLKKKSLQEIAIAIYGGVVAAYQERSMPFRATIFDEELTYSLGLFMGTRMREVMYLAELLNVDAFDQPNVELYKQHTRSILGVT
jgi:glucose-6-phosphate isomerase